MDRGMVSRERELDGFDWLADHLTKYGLELKPAQWRQYMNDIQDYFVPLILRSPAPDLKAAFEHMEAAMKILRPGTAWDARSSLMDAGIKAPTRSDLRMATQFAKDSGLVEFRPGQPSTWVRRLTNGSNAADTVAAGAAGTDAAGADVAGADVAGK